MGKETRASSYGTRNAYQCRACSGIVITQDLEDGTTPFMIRCLATDGCIGTMESATYRRPFGGKEAIPIRPHYHWRKPTADEYKTMSPAMKQHIDMGGLEIYPVMPSNPRTLPKVPFK